MERQLFDLANESFRPTAAIGVRRNERLLPGVQQPASAVIAERSGALGASTP